MNKQPKVAIIILNHNGYKDTIECLKSLEKINYKNKSIWVLDNGSSDESVKKIKKFNRNNKIHLVISKENLGQTGGDNLLIRKILKNMDPKYILLLDNDTIVEKNFLNILVNFSEKNPDVGVVAPLIYKYSQKNILNPVNCPGKFNLWIGGGSPHKKILKTPFKVDYASGCCWLIKRNVIEKVGMLNEKYFAYKEEIELAYRIKKAKYKFYIIPESKIWHKGSSTSKKITGFRQYHEIRNSLFFVREYGSFFQKIFFVCYVLSYKVLKHLYLNFKSGKDIWVKNNKFIKGIKDGLFKSYQ